MSSYHTKLSHFEIPPQNIKSQIYIDKIQKWTNENLMKVNAKKTQSNDIQLY